MNSLQIRYFLLLAKHPSFTDVAEYLKVSQSAVSKQIAALETELGVVLFIRSSRDVSLTPAGRMMAEYFDRTSEQLKVVRRQMRSHMAGSEGTLSVGLLPEQEMAGLPQAMLQFYEMHPEAELRVERFPYRHLYDEDSFAGYDVLITFQRAVCAPAVCSWEPLFPTHFNLILSSSHPMASVKELSPADLRHNIFYAPDAKTREATFTFIEELGKHYGFMPKGMLSVSNVESLLTAVAGGEGVAILNSNVSLYNPNLFRVVETDIHSPVGAVWAKQNRSPLIQDFIHCLKQSIG